MRCQLKPIREDLCGRRSIAIMFFWSTLLFVNLASALTKAPLFGMPKPREITADISKNTNDQHSTPARGILQSEVLRSDPDDHLQVLTQASQQLSLPEDSEPSLSEILDSPPITNFQNFMSRLNTISPTKSVTSLWHDQQKNIEVPHNVGNEPDVEESVFPQGEELRTEEELHLELPEKTPGVQLVTFELPGPETLADLDNPNLELVNQEFPPLDELGSFADVKNLKFSYIRKETPKNSDIQENGGPLSSMPKLKTVNEFSKKDILEINNYRLMESNRLPQIELEVVKDTPSLKTSSLPQTNWPAIKSVEHQTLPEFVWPEIRPIDLSKFKWPTLQSLHELKWPEIKLPATPTLPPIPGLKLPLFNFAQPPLLTKFKWPELKSPVKPNVHHVPEYHVQYVQTPVVLSLGYPMTSLNYKGWAFRPS